MTPRAGAPTLSPYIAEEAIQVRIHELARQIENDYRGKGDIVLVGVLRGSFIFLADLTRCLTLPHHVDFIAVSSYGSGTTSSGVVRLVMDLRTDIEGKHVIIVEDIVDTGRTLQYLIRSLGARGPASVKTCALLRKLDRREVDVPVDYLGFDIPDAWVVGYGLDYADQYRTLPYIGVLEWGLEE